MRYLKFTLFLLILYGGNTYGQKILQLDNCYQLLNKNYPLAQQKKLLDKQNTLNADAINSAKMPQLNLAIKGTYQSDVTFVDVPLPNVTIPAPNKDQYRATVTANQLLYNDGLIEAQSKVNDLSIKVKKWGIDVTLYQLRQRVNALYFSSLILDEKTHILNDKKTALKGKLEELGNAVKFGTALEASKAVLEAELLKINQQIFDNKATKTALLNSLSKLIGTPVNSETILEAPVVNWHPANTLNRPELNYFELQKQQIKEQSNLLGKTNKPKIMVFAQGGYGNPGLNLFDQNFATYYMVGLQLNWRVFDGQKTKKQRQSLDINKDIIDTQKKAFELNTKIENSSQLAEINKFQAFIKSDKEIINLRQTILKTREAQLKNGLITASDYLTELTNLYNAKTDLKTHNIQLVWAQINYLTTNGNYETTR